MVLFALHYLGTGLTGLEAGALRGSLGCIKASLDHMRPPRSQTHMCACVSSIVLILMNSINNIIQA